MAGIQIKTLPFTLDSATFSNLFPFYIMVDERLVIESMGKSIPKLLPYLEEQHLLSDYFTVQRPYIEQLTPKKFKGLVGLQVVMTSNRPDLITLKGQIEPYNNGFLFIGSPWLASMDEVHKKGLTTADFALHDPSLDLLGLFKNQEINNKELKVLLETVDEQRIKLKKDKDELNRLSLVASANKNGVVFTHPNGKIFWCNEAFISITGLENEVILGQRLKDLGRSKLTNKNEIYKMVDAFNQGKTFDAEYIYEKQNGETFWAKVTGQPLLDANKKVSQYFAIIEDITVEKQHEEQLMLLSSIAEKNSNGVVISDKEGRIEWVNSSFLEMTEYSFEELVGQKPGQLLQGSETDPKTINYLKAQIKNGLPFNCEIINYSKSNQKYWVRIQGQALHNRYGDVIKYFSIEEDITFEKEFNQQLIESENRMNALISNLQSGVLLEDENRKIQIVNSKFCALFGIDAEPELLKGFDSAIFEQGIKHHFKDPDKFVKRTDEILKQKKLVSAEEIMLVDGRVFERSFIPIDSENKYDAGHLWSYYDVTIKKKYKESLEAEREKYSNIIANMNIGLLEVDTNETILLANQSFSEMSGFSNQELIGHKAFDLLLHDETERKAIEKHVADHTKEYTKPYEVKVVTQHGDIRYWLVSGAPNYNVNGEYIGSIGIHLDITEQKKLELQKEQLLNRLEKQNEYLNEYAQMVSHDLKSPLRSIHSLVSWIKEDNEKEFNSQTKQYLNLIQDKVEKMDLLIQGILTYSKVDSNKVSAEEMVDLNDVISNILEIIHIPDNVTITLSNEFPTLKSDRFQMQQLFQNLISNAVTYSDKEHGLVTLSSHTGKTHYTFTIEDNGPGIDPKYQSKIFDLFQTFSNEEKSTGIGLAIVKRIVDSYKGKVWIESQIGKGATFFIKLPKKYGKA